MKTKSKVITLCASLLDYMTLTSWDEDFYKVQDALMTQLEASEPVPHKVAQYLGGQFTSELGSLFAGDAEIKGRRHYICQISGELANDTDIWRIVAPYVKSGAAEITRLDVQMTVHEPAGWSQRDFFNDREARGKTVGWAQSTTNSGQCLRTVYVGARESGLFLRLYEKLASDTRLLRCEFEIKRPYAPKWGRQLFAGDVTIAQILRLYIENTKHDGLKSMYIPHMFGIFAAPKLQTIKEDNKTEKWLLKQVLPTFIRIINEHGSNGEVARAYLEAIERHKDWNGLS
jgi:hypothetical protein